MHSRIILWHRTRADGFAKLRITHMPLPSRELRCHGAGALGRKYWTCHIESCGMPALDLCSQLLLGVR